jgi:hypothetical protein
MTNKSVISLIKVIKFLLILIIFPFIAIKVFPFLDSFIINYFDFDFSIFSHKNNNNDLNLSPSTPPSSISSENNLILEAQRPNNNDKYYNFKINKQVADSISNTIIEGAKLSFNTVLPNAASLTAAGAVGVTALKMSSGLPLPSRLAFVGLYTTVAAAGTKLGLAVADSLTNNGQKIKDIMENSIKNSKHSNTDIEKIPSPDIDNSFIFSILERNEIINDSNFSEIFLTNIFGFNVLVLILSIIILIYIFNRNVVKLNL